MLELQDNKQLQIIFDPYIFLGFVSAFLASLFWMAAMTKFEITKAYPFMSLAPALVFLFGVLLLGEEFTWGKLIGLSFVVFGIVITLKLLSLDYRGKMILAPMVKGLYYMYFFTF